jgi:hypothetical protein
LTLTPEARQHLEALEEATSRLAGLNRDCAEQVGQALEERARAVDAIAGWIAGEQQASRPVSPELASRLARDLERGADIVVRLTLDREAARLALAEVARGLQLLRGLRPVSPVRTNTIDCQG